MSKNMVSQVSYKDFTKLTALTYFVLYLFDGKLCCTSDTGAVSAQYEFYDEISKLKPCWTSYGIFRKRRDVQLSVLHDVETE